MKIIHEDDINLVLDQLEEKAYFNLISQNFVEEQPALISYIESDSFDILTAAEHDLFWYSCLIIYTAIKEVHPEIPVLKNKTIEEAEEKNYALLSDHTKFVEMADSFFSDYRQEDLLAFVEDTLIPDEEDFITPVGRKVMMVSLKSIIDAFEEIIS